MDVETGSAYQHHNQPHQQQEIPPSESAAHPSVTPPASPNRSIMSGEMVLSPTETASADNDDGVNDTAQTPKKKSSPTKAVIDTVRVVLPKVEPLPWCTFFSLSFKVAIP